MEFPGFLENTSIFAVQLKDNFREKNNISYNHTGAATVILINGTETNRSD